MKSWYEGIDKWAITRIATDDLIMIYKGSFMEIMNFLCKNYEDGDVDVESYENWRNRKESLYEQMFQLWLYVGRP